MAHAWAKANQLPEPTAAPYTVDWTKAANDPAIGPAGPNPMRPRRVAPSAAQVKKGMVKLQGCDCQRLFKRHSLIKELCINQTTILFRPSTHTICDQFIPAMSSKQEASSIKEALLKKVRLVRHTGKTTTAKIIDCCDMADLALPQFRHKRSLESDFDFAIREGDETTNIDEYSQERFTVKEILYLNDKRQYYEIHLIMRVREEKEDKKKDEEEIKAEIKHDEECLKNKQEKAQKEKMLVDETRMQLERYKEAIQCDQTQQEAHARKKLQQMIQQNALPMPEAFGAKQIQELDRKLAEKSQLTQELIKEFSQAVLLTPNEFMRSHQGRVCKTYLIRDDKSQISKEHIIDFMGSRFIPLDGQNQSNISQFETFNSETAQKLASALKESVQGTSAEVIVGGFESSIGTVAKHSTSNIERQSSRAQINMTQRHRCIWSFLVKKSYLSKPEQLAFDRYAKKAFHELFRCYEEFSLLKAQGKSYQDQLRTFEFQKEHFKQRYGSHVQTGIYSFGGKFILTQKFTFDKSTTQQDQEFIMSQEYSVQVKGRLRTIGTSMGHSSTESEQDAKKERQLRSKHTLKIQNYSHPLIYDHGVWSEAIEKNMRHWQLINKKTDKVGIGRVMANESNAVVEPARLKLYKEFCHSFDHEQDMAEEMKKLLIKPQETSVFSHNMNNISNKMDYIVQKYHQQQYQSRPFWNLRIPDSHYFKVQGSKVTLCTANGQVTAKGPQDPLDALTSKGKCFRVFGLEPLPNFSRTQLYLHKISQSGVVRVGLMNDSSRSDPSGSKYIIQYSLLEKQGTIEIHDDRQKQIAQSFDLGADERLIISVEISSRRVFFNSMTLKKEWGAFWLPVTLIQEPWYIFAQLKKLGSSIEAINTSLK